MSCRHFVKDKFHECAQADDGDEMKNLALQNDWRNCPNCSVVIELGEACNHMRCGWCGCDFCFICLKTVEQRCRCPTYGKAEVDEDGFEVITGLHPATRLDREGYDRQGFNRRGINRAGKHFSETMVLSELGEMESEDERRKVRKTVGYRREEEEARRWLEAAVAGWQPDIARAWVEEGLARWREG
ncbi:MAG: hypothetical protein M1828_003398 [Chrysothrix sp. TS-e1954]|nr:MAG: hypothetical protein M1828_003398 [Chrysothrix sp. TS-e1954]